MTCQSCGHHLQHADRFCGACGREVVRDTAEGMPITEFWGGQDAQPQQGPGDGSDREVPPAPPTQPIRVQRPVSEPLPPRQAPPGGPARRELPTEAAFPAGSAWATQHEERRSGGGVRWLIPLLALLLAIPLVWWAVSRSTSDTAAPPASSTGASPSATSSSPSTVPTSSAPTSSTSSSTTSLKDRIAARKPVSVSVVTSCENGSGPLTGVGTGTPGTSCPFASSVAKAYRAAVDDPSASDPVSLSGVRSPVTGKEYAMTCSGIAPVRCTGGNNAVVLIYGSEDLPR